jgi:hypothetical protein
MRGLIDELTKAYTWQRRRIPDPYTLAEFSSAVGKLARMSSVLDGFTQAVRLYQRMPRQPGTD